MAAWLGVTTAWVYAETRADRIPHIPVGRYYRYRPSSSHADAKTTQIYAHYAPSAHGVAMVNDAFLLDEPAPAPTERPRLPGL